MKSIACLAILLATSLIAHAAPEECRVAPVFKDSSEHIRWNGPCKDGWAEGEGILEKQGGGKRSWRYEGTVQRGRPHGQGYMKFGDGHKHEGEYVDGLPHGMGVFLSPIGDRYDGSFKAGRREGQGSMSYKLGGRYDGAWKNDKYNGRGRVEYAGGRKLVTTFVDGVPLGQTAVTTEARTESKQRYQLNDSEPVTGSLLPRAIASGSDVPLDKTYAELTDAERNIVKARYPLMDEADEPPYPLRGPAPIQRWLSQGAGRTASTGELHVIVMIDSEGKALSADVYASPDPEMTKFATSVLLLEKFKPARCAGQPCAMAFPFRVSFVRGF